MSDIGKVLSFFRHHGGPFLLPLGPADMGPIEVLA